MLNEWSDRVPPRPRRARLLRPELGAALFSVFAMVSLAAGALAWLLR